MNGNDKAICLAILKRGLRNSRYYYQSGQQATAYVNIDLTVLGDDFGMDSSPQHEVIQKMADQFIRSIQQIEEERSFDRLAFIDKDGNGPVGMIALSGLLILKSLKEAIFVRPYRNTVRSTTKGRSVQPGEKILIISDVATTGQTILKAAERIWEAEAVVTGALVFFDQELGAKRISSQKTSHFIVSLQEAKRVENQEFLCLIQRLKSFMSLAE